MSYAEFPHTNYEDTDFHELIELYKKVHDEYSGTLEQINTVSNKLDNYQSSMNAVIREQVDTATKSAMATYTSTIESTLTQIRTSINNLNNQLDRYVDSLQVAVEKLNENLSTETIDRKSGDSLLSEQINNLANRVNSISSDIAMQIASEHSYLEKELDSIRKEVDLIVTESFTHAISESTMYTAQQINALDYKLSEKIREIAEASGHKAIKWVWQYGCYHGGFSAIQWYYLTEISADEWNETSINCIEWYVEAKEIFTKFDNRNKMFSPVSGRWVDVKVALMELAVALNINAMTAEEYESLGLTADEYDRFFITAQQYDWAGKGDKLCTVNKPNC